ncbi:hypothetical protein AB0H49_27595 [Nocardia sp. NPDC050713]|uniref:hypothetical protein n=1 Tax=Nocardia sp. NPDC050713 TaxID=3154511 RepID=UPI00340C3523
MKIARLFDDIDPSGTPIIESRRKITDSATKERILGFLRGGAVILAANGKSVDMIDATNGKVVPRVYKTDGAWIWTAAARYYLEKYDIAPEDEFLLYIASHGYQASTPDPDMRHQAYVELTNRSK